MALFNSTLHRVMGSTGIRTSGKKRNWKGELQVQDQICFRVLTDIAFVPPAAPAHYAGNGSPVGFRYKDFIGVAESLLFIVPVHRCCFLCE